MAKVKLNDIEMYYEIHGKGEAIVFIAGFSVDHTTWNLVIDQFKESYQVILFDNRGSGQTDVPAGVYSIDAMTDDVVALCAKLEITKAHFIGNSMGGFILQNLALRYPNLVKSAIISNSTMTINTCFHIYLAAQLEFMKAAMPAESLIKASCSWVFSYRFLSQPDKLRDLIKLGIDNPYPFSIPGHEGQYAALSQFDSRSWVKEISVPTLICAGDQDLIFSEQSVALLAEHIPNTQYYCFSDCGHLPQIEYPEQFYTVVNEFICTQSGL